MVRWEPWSNTKNISNKAWGYTFSVGNLNDNGVQSPYYGRLRGLGAMFCAGTDAGEGDYTVNVSCGTLMLAAIYPLDQPLPQIHGTCLLCQDLPQPISTMTSVAAVGPVLWFW